MCTKGVWIGDGWEWERGVLGISDIEGLLICDTVVETEDDISVICDLGLLEGRTGVTLRVCVVKTFLDSGVEDGLGAEGYISEEEYMMMVREDYFTSSEYAFLFQQLWCFGLSSSFAGFWRWYELKVVWNYFFERCVVSLCHKWVCHLKEDLKKWILILKRVLRVLTITIERDHFVMIVQ